MAGFTGEKRWRNNMNRNAPDTGVSETVKRISAKMIEALNESEAEYAELQELYLYAGGTVQDLANLLFTEDIAARTTPGTNAELTVDVTTGAISGVTISVAGTGYTDGNYQLKNVAVAGESGTGVINYTVSGRTVTAASVVVGGTGYTDGTGVLVTNFPLAGPVSETTANADEVAKTQAAFDAVTALHELYQAATNVAVTQEDRLAQLRRMS